MRKRACIAATQLMADRQSGLSEAERLQLEYHLGTCPACAADERDLYRLIVGTGANDMPQLNARARHRAIAGALLRRGPGDELDAPAPRRWLRWAMPSVALAGAAAAALVFVLAGDHSSPRTETATVDAHYVIAGELEAPAGALAPGMQFDADVPLTTRQGARVAVGHAQVLLGADTTVSWNPTSSTLTLRDGSARASVDPGPKLPFRVATAEFSVEVLGTEFEITNDGVTVFEGRVRVTGDDGEVFVDELGPGEAWHVPDEIAIRPRRARKRRARSVEPEPEPGNPVELLDEARAHLAAGEVKDARDDLDGALALAEEPAHKAEALTLLAECELVDGNHREAVRQYRRVAYRYRKVRAGENALFAAARIEVRDGRAEDARDLLELYLRRYPEGRFVEEAHRRLAELGELGGPAEPQ